MASGGLVIGCFLLLAALGLHVAGLATTYWYSVTAASIEAVHAGLFQICVSSICYTYISYGFSWSVHYIGFVGLQCIGGLLQLIGLISALASCSNENQRPPVQNLAGLCFSAGGCIVAGIIWFIVVVYVNTSSYLSVISTVVDIELGWSFYLSCAGGGLTCILAITLCIVAGNMQSGAVQATPPTAMVVMTGQQQGAVQHAQPYGPYGQQPQNPQYHSPEKGW